MQCREQCGACCIAPTISQPFYGMPSGKPAGIRCTHLSVSLRCDLFGDPRRPSCCLSFQPEASFCGNSTEQAMQLMACLEDLDDHSDGCGV